MPLRHVAAVTVGNALEFYDFITFAYFSIYIGRAFFPGEYSLLASLLTFGVSFLMRPVGGFVIGRWADRRGRRPALVLCLMLMGIAVTGMALTPSYASIGIAAPILLIMFRLLQAFALGGQVGPATAYMVEAAPPQHRGFYTSLQYTSQDFASLVAGLVGVTLANLMDEQGLQDWGWRIALLLGSVVVPFGLWLRVTLPETAVVATPTAPREHVRIRPYARAIALTIAMLGAATIANYTINYLTTYALDTLKLPATIAFWVPVVSGLVFVLSEPFSGWLSDRIGRKPVMVWPGFLLLIAIWPAFYLLNAHPGAFALLSMTAVLVLLQGLSTTPILTSLTETLPMAVRAGTIGIVYAVAIATFGGSTQPLAKVFIDASGDPLAPAYYMTATWLIGLIAMALTKETAPVKVGLRGTQ
jgi:MFS transporter, MHS family, citrate/tricarballylate:H+ symporter